MYCHHKHGMRWRKSTTNSEEHSSEHHKYLHISFPCHFSLHSCVSATCLCGFYMPFYAPTKLEVQVVPIISGTKKMKHFLPSKKFYNTINKLHKPFSLNTEGAGLLCCFSEQAILLKWWRRVFHFRIYHKEQAWLGSLHLLESLQRAAGMIFQYP